MTLAPSQPLPLRRILRTWWPLAMSWLFMAAELPLVSAVIARLSNPETNLAAYGGIVFPLALIIESPIIMLLAASTALSKDWDSYNKMRRWMMRASALLTGLHVLVAFTPLYYLIAEKLIGAPPEILAPGRLGLMIMTPWTWAIAYRRFHQGVLIRFDQSKAVGFGTMIRLCVLATVLTVGYSVGTLPGIVVGTSAITSGVVSEAVYAGLRVRPVLRRELKLAAPVQPALTFGAFLRFYVPLVMTTLFILLTEPIGSAALSRMPLPLESLAVWPVIGGFLFMLQSAGAAYNEVAVALLDQPHSAASLRRFALILVSITTAILLLVVATPLSGLWFGRVSALTPALAAMAGRSLWLALLLPGFTVLQNWYQGALVHSRSTRAVTEAVAVYIVVNLPILGLGLLWQNTAGLYFGVAALSAATVAQTAWLWWRSRPAIQAVQDRDAVRLSPAGASAD